MNVSTITADEFNAINRAALALRDAMIQPAFTRWDFLRSPVYTSSLNERAEARKAYDQIKKQANDQYEATMKDARSRLIAE